MYANNTVTAFSYAVGAGFDYNLNSSLQLGLGYRFSDLGKAQLGQATIDTTQVPGTLGLTHIYNNELLAQLIWKI